MSNLKKITMTLADGTRRAWDVVTAADVAAAQKEVVDYVGQVADQAYDALNDIGQKVNTADSKAEAATGVARSATSAADTAAARVRAEIHTHMLCEHTDYGQPTTLRSKFSSDAELLRFPSIDTSKCTDFVFAAYECYNLEEVPEDLDTSAAVYLNSAFYGCPRLKRFPSCNTSKVKNMSFMLQNSANSAGGVPAGGEGDALTYVGDLDTGSCTTVCGLFAGRGNLERFPATLDLRRCTSAHTLFCGCHKLTEANMPTLQPPQQKCNGGWMFANTAITALPLGGDFSWNTSAWRLFWGCTRLVHVGDLDLTGLKAEERGAGNCEWLDALFDSCANLETVGTVTLNGDDVIPEGAIAPAGAYVVKLNPTAYIQSRRPVDAHKTYGNVPVRLNKLRQITFRNLGNIYNGNGAEKEISLYIDYPAWGSGDTAARQSLVDSLLTYSVDRAARGIGTCRVFLPGAVINRLTTEEKAAITAKGYTLANYL